MPNPFPNPKPSPKAGLEGFDAYRVAREFLRLVLKATAHLPRSRGLEQLIDAAESAMRNIAEAHAVMGADRARRARTAAAEASECKAELDALEIRGALGEAALGELRALLDRELAMLWRIGRAR
jgi:four helix bundle protein